MTELISILQNALAPGYTLERELTGAGMSRVFVATDVALGRKVVVKVLPPELSAGVNHERFRREIQVAAQLQHPHIVQLLSAGEEGSLIWYTMPYINGHSLRDAIANGEQRGVKDVVRILRDVADALDYAHGLGVIHRDIKPGNVLLMGAHALVTDFGVAKAISASMPSSGFTSAGMAIGTPAYMAPEQIAADPAADHRMDLYALGLLAYEMLTGAVPFKEDSPQRTMAAQLTRDPEPLENSRRDIPPALSKLIGSLLEKHPENRPQLASEVVSALDDIAVSSGQSLAPLRPVARPSAARALTLVAAAVSLVGTAWWLGERTGTQAGTEFLLDSLAAAESVQVLSSPAALLTREDSMAIARAVSERMADRRPATSRSGTGRGDLRSDSVALVGVADSIRSQIQRAVLDSLVQLSARFGIAATQLERTSTVAALSTATEELQVRPTPAVRSAGPRRVIVALPRPSRVRPELDAIAIALADSLRFGLDAHPRYVVVPADSVAAALREARTVNGLQESLQADLIVSITLRPAGDSVIRLISVRDLLAPTGTNLRTESSAGPSSDPTAGLSALVPRVIRLLVDVERARTQPDGGARGATRPPQPPAATESPRRRP